MPRRYSPLKSFQDPRDKRRTWLHKSKIRPYVYEYQDALTGTTAVFFVGEVTDLIDGAAWISDQFPLVYAPAGSPARRADRPDIVVVIVESLRAEDLSFVTGREGSVTPSLDALAARSVVFTSYLSNAFPSAPSVLHAEATSPRAAAQAARNARAPWPTATTARLPNVRALSRMRGCE